MLVKYSETEYHIEGWALGGTFANLAAGDCYIIAGFCVFCNNIGCVDKDQKMPNAICAAVVRSDLA